MRISNLILLVALTTPGLSQIGFADEQKKEPEHIGEYIPVEEYRKPEQDSPKPRIFYTVLPISVVTEIGILGVAPGTPLTLIEEREEGFFVTNGKDKFLVDKSSVSIDIKRAMKARQEYIRVQSELKSEIAKTREKMDRIELERRKNMKGMVD